MKQVTLLSRPNCPLCEEAKQLLLLIKENQAFDLKEVNIYQDDALLEKYQLMIPVVQINGKDVEYGQIDMDVISKALAQ